MIPHKPIGQRHAFRWIVLMSIAILPILAVSCVMPTLTPTPDRVVLTGLVYNAKVGPTQPIAKALLSGYLSNCSLPVSRVCQTHSGSDGRYSLDLCGMYGMVCQNVRLEVSMTGYMTLTQNARTADLLANPKRDFGLTPNP